MSGLEPASEVEVARMANGSGPPPEDMVVEAVTEKDCEEKNGDEKKDEDNEDGNEKNDGEEKKDREGPKEGEENGMEKVELAEEEEKKTEDANTEEAEDVKMVDAEDLKTVEAEDVKMVDEEDAKDVGEGVNEVGEEEGGAESKLEKVNDVKEERDGENMQKKVDENKVEGSKKKGARGRKASSKGEAKEKKERGTQSKELLSTPTPSSIDRPVRERKTVERLVEVIEKEPNKEFLVEKGRGTPLKDIPNVAYKLARKKPADLKLLHQTLFGRKGKAVNFKNHILQFSGFVWHESDEKQRAKMKEKLDKYVKDTLLDLCDLFDIPVSKATMRKEDLVAKLLDFLVAPHPTSDAIFAEKEQSMISRKHKRVTKGSASKGLGGTPTKQSRKKQTKSEETSNRKGKSAQEKDEVEEDNENSVSEEDQALKQSESEAKESESEEAADEDDVDEDLEKSKGDKKRSRQRGSVAKGKSKVETSSIKSSFPPTTKILTKPPSSKRPKAEEDKDVGAKVFSRKKKNVDAAKKKSTPKSDKEEKATGKKVARGKAKSVGAEYPSEEELRKTICEILKEVDFNTATFTDILKQLATHYKMDLTPRKPAIKELIQEELTKLADELDESGDDEDEEDDKEENPEPSGKQVKT